jgi:alpha-ketoglutarate-dependent taurine dioxygenase
MRIEFQKPFGARVSELDLATAADADRERLDDAFRRHSLVVFPELFASPEQHVALVERHGEVRRGFGGAKHHYLEHDGGDRVALVMGGEISFHSDETFLDDPIEIISLAADVIPPAGGETVFAHGGVAYAVLPAALRARIAQLSAVHLYDASVPVYRGRFTEEILGEHPLRSAKPIVRAHPYTGEPVLAVTYQHAGEVVGLEREVSDALLAELFDALYDPDRLYRHSWRVGDLVLWDNRVMQHARRPFDPRAPRRMRRVTIATAQSEWFESTYGHFIVSATSEVPTRPLGRFSGSGAQAQRAVGFSA